MKTFGVTDYTNLAPYSVLDGRIGRTTGRSGPTTRPAFAKATQVTKQKQIDNKIFNILVLTEQVLVLYCSMVNATFLSLFSNKILVGMVVIHKMFVRIANREDSDQTASSDADYRIFYKKKITMEHSLLSDLFFQLNTVFFLLKNLCKESTVLISEVLLNNVDFNFIWFSSKYLLIQIEFGINWTHRIMFQRNVFYLFV